jgi:hypothetical protein
MTNRNGSTNGAVVGGGADQPLRWRRAERSPRTSRNGEWAAGVYSPAESSIVEIDELVDRQVPTLFVLLEGRVTIVFANNIGELHEHVLEPGQPLLVTAPHAAFCPDGPHEGVVLMVERAELRTWQTSSTSLEW